MCSPVVAALEASGFRRVSLLAEGAACDTFSVAQDQRHLVVKVLRWAHPQDAPGRYWTRAFRREGEYLNQFADVPGLVRAVAVNEVLPVDGKERACHVLLDAGTDLERRAVDRGAAIAAMARVASVLATLHADGVVHRDLKPANIFADGSSVVLGDLGAAGPVSEPDREHFYRYLYPYNVRFAAPELFAGFGTQGEAYPAADVWSLGATLAWLCTGLYIGECLVEPAERMVMVRSFARVRGQGRLRAYREMRPMLDRRFHAAVRDLRRRWPGAGDALAKLLAALLAVAPDDRPTAAEAAAVLRGSIVSDHGGVG